MRHSTCAVALAGASCALAIAATPVAAQQRPLASPFATRVVAFDDKNRAGGGIFDPKNALGAPDGSTKVHSLGIGGSLTLGFDVTITDGPGVDLLVAENPFASLSQPWKSFAEVAYVEVSTNGTDFARFPARYSGPQRDPGPFAFVEIGWYTNLTGVLPVRAGARDPLDPVLAGGDAFDLADLRGHPLVVAGKVDLGRITQVRLVDAVSGVSLDARGARVRDTGSGSADIDAVTVLQHRGNQTPRGPTVDLRIPPDGAFTLTIRDPDGLADLDPSSWRVALFGIQVSAGDLLAVARVTHVGATSFTLALPGPLPPGLPLQMTVSIRDRAGSRSADAAVRPL